MINYSPILVHLPITCTIKTVPKKTFHVSSLHTYSQWRISANGFMASKNELDLSGDPPVFSFLNTLNFFRIDMNEYRFWGLKVTFNPSSWIFFQGFVFGIGTNFYQPSVMNWLHLGQRSKSLWPSTHPKFLNVWMDSFSFDVKCYSAHMFLRERGLWTRVFSFYSYMCFLCLDKDSLVGGSTFLLLDLHRIVTKPGVENGAFQKTQT